MSIENTAHFVMQSKGGAGKSVCSVLLAQFLSELSPNITLIDTDPSNKTLGSYQALDVKKIEVLNREKIVDQSKFDHFINDFLTSNYPMLVDTGSGEFLPINSYIMQNEIAEIFESQGKQLIIHCPITFGQSKEETVRCLLGIIENHPTTPIVVWQNEYFGVNEEDFTKSKLFKAVGNIVGTVKIRQMSADTEQRDFSKMLQSSMTFKEVQNSTNPEFGFIQKSRLERIRRELWDQLDELFDFMAAHNKAGDQEQKIS